MVFERERSESKRRTREDREPDRKEEFVREYKRLNEGPRAVKEAAKRRLGRLIRTEESDDLGRLRWVKRERRVFKV